MNSVTRLGDSLHCVGVGPRAVDAARVESPSRSLKLAKVAVGVAHAHLRVGLVYVDAMWPMVVLRPAAHAARRHCGSHLEDVRFIASMGRRRAESSLSDLLGLPAWPSGPPEASRGGPFPPNNFGR